MEKKSKTYLLYELRDGLKDGREKNQELLAIEDDFIETVKATGKFDKFAFMFDNWLVEKQRLEESINRVPKRIAACNKLIEMLEKNNSKTSMVEMIFNLVIDALGIAETEENQEEQTAEIELELPKFEENN